MSESRLHNAAQFLICFRLHGFLPPSHLICGYPWCWKGRERDSFDYYVLQRISLMPVSQSRIQRNTCNASVYLVFYSFIHSFICSPFLYNMYIAHIQYIRTLWPSFSDKYYFILNIIIIILEIWFYSSSNTRYIIEFYNYILLYTFQVVRRKMNGNFEIPALLYKT